MKRILRWPLPAGLLLSVLLGPGAAVFAQDPEEETTEDAETLAPDATLAATLEVLAAGGLIEERGGSRERLERLLQQGEELFFGGQNARAATVLYEVVESPSYSDFSSLPTFRGAEFMLARSLDKMGAYRSAERVLLRLLGRGSDDIYFGPAVRKFVDVTLAAGDVQRGIGLLEEIAAEEPTEDLSDELQYLRGRFYQQAGDATLAREAFEDVSRRSRFYASAQYLQGVIATEGGDLEEAETLFCSVTSTDKDDRYALFADDRFFEVRDLARLGLGRVAHENVRSDDAFYYYFQVPNDSPEVAAALFESAYSMYEGEDHDTALDLLDQLDVRFSATAFSDEATLLRGYIYLARCQYEQARQQFDRYREVFEPVRDEVRAALADEDRRDRLFEEVLASDADDGARPRSEEREDWRDQFFESGETPAPQVGEGLAAEEVLQVLLRVDPDFYQLHRQIRSLDAEAARAGRVAQELAGIRGRLAGDEQPRAALREADEMRAAQLTLGQDLARTEENLRALRDQVERLENAGDGSEAQAMQGRLRDIRERVRAMRRRLEIATPSAVRSASASLSPALLAVDERLAADEAQASRFPARVAALRRRLVAAAGAAAENSLTRLRDRIDGGVRRAQIGTIDAVMGSKRRIEGQIESLAAGRFPPELVDPLREQGLLNDDEEYWPFEGEYWADEFNETDPLDEDDEEGDDLEEGELEVAAEGDDA